MLYLNFNDHHVENTGMIEQLSCPSALISTNHKHLYSELPLSFQPITNIITQLLLF